MPNLTRTIPALVITLLLTTPVLAGSTRVIDGDTLELEGGQRVRLQGIDAPEMKQSCEREQD